MELQFLGRGGAFNTKEGNTSAYFIEDSKLFLIDCGESVFKCLKQNNILDNITSIYLMITHTHSDHVGSLGSLVAYSYHILHREVNIVLPTDAKYLKNIEDVLNGYGCRRKSYKFINEKELDNMFNTFETIRFEETIHCPELDCYGIIFNTKTGVIYYSGDTKEIRILKDLIDSNAKIDKVYIDVTTDNYEDCVHLYIKTLSECVPSSLKDKIYCMHVNSDECIQVAKTLGFNVVEVK